MAIVTLRYDLRAPTLPGVAPGAGHPERYTACLEQCAFADAKGIGMVSISEHHGLDDGYLPSPLVLAAAIGARTTSMMISISALLVPFYEPLRLAEDLAVLDLVTGGRVAVVAGLGYRYEEFEMFGVDRGRRGKLLDETLETLLRAWTGEPFEFRGRTVCVTPRPRTQPHPMLLVGGSTEVAARRAARHRLPFMPAIGDPELAATYRAACEAGGWDGGMVLLPSGPGFVHVCADPEKAWVELEPFARHEATTYSAWQTPGQRSAVHTDAATLDELKASGVYRVVTPDECVQLASELGPTGAIVLHPLMGGMDPALGWESLELFVDQVLPRL